MERLGLPVVRARADEFMARCPVHEDRTPSMHVRYRPDVHDGSTWLRCYGCQAPADQIVEQLGLTVSDLFDAPPATRTSAGPRRAKRDRLGPLPALLADPETEQTHEWAQVAVYEYAGAAGQLMQTVTREECSAGHACHKTFRQRFVVDGRLRRSKPTGFVPALYRTPAVLTAIAAGQPVQLVEGEKDCHAAVDAGWFAATTNPGGAGALTETMADQLAAAAEVVAVLDRDHAGYQRGVQLHALIAGRTAVRLLLPAAGKDLTDHLATGRSLDELVEVRVDELAVWLAAGRVGQLLEGTRRRTVATAVDQIARQLAAGGDEGRRAARRWTAELPRLRDEIARGAEEVHTLAVAAGTEWAADAADAADAILAAADVMIGQASTATEQADTTTDEVDPAGQQATTTTEDAVRPTTVVRAPALPNDDGPSYVVPMSTGAWRYSLGDDGWTRGVWRLASTTWLWMAPLPLILERLVRRDGSTRRADTSYRLSLTPDGAEVAVCGPDTLASGEWADRLGIALSADMKVMSAAATAIRLAGEAMPEVELTAGWVDDRLVLPPDDVAPRTYGQVHGDEQASRVAWRRIATLLAVTPKAALAAGVAAGGPYVAPLRRQPFFFFLSGASSQGKSTTLTVSSAIYGRPDIVGPSWNTTGIGIAAELGELGCLPAFRDELGASGLAPNKLESLIFQLTEGASRTRGAQHGGHRSSPIWRAPLITTGNDTIHGRIANEGILARVVEVDTPITRCRDEADEMSYLAERHYGWPQRWLHAAAVTPEQFSGRIEQAQTEFGAGGGVPRRLSEHLALGVAGAELLEDALGVPGIRQAAAAAAGEVYARLVAEMTERGISPADRLIGAVTDAVVSRPLAFPDRDDHNLAHAAGKDSASYRDLEGFLLGRDEQGRERIGVLTTKMAGIAAAAGIEDALVGIRGLHQDGRLSVGCGEAGRYRTKVRIAGRQTNLYVFALPADDEPPQAATTHTAPDIAPTDALPLPAYAPPPLGDEDHTLAIDGQPCAGCGDSTTLRLWGIPAHLRCRQAAWDLRRATPPAAPTADAVAVAASAPQDTPERAARANTTAADASGPTDHSAPPTGTQRPAEPRWRAPAAVLDAESVYLPGGEVQPWPEWLTTPGDLVQLALELRLGHGGDRKRLPDQGAVYLYGPAAERLGLDQAGGDVDKAIRGAQTAPTVTETLAAGWTFSRADKAHPAGKVDGWTRIYRAGQRGAAMAVLPWLPAGVPLLDTTDPAELAERLAMFADTLGAPYRLSPAATGQDLMMSTRPVGPDPDNPADPEALTSPAQLPAIASDAIEHDLSWHRPWDEMLATEQAARYVHLFDRNSCYPAATSSLPLGVGDLHELDAEQATAAWAAHGDKVCGYWLVEVWQWSHWGMPDPLLSVRRGRTETTRWVTSPTLATLARNGIEPAIHAAYTWDRSPRWLSLWNARVRDARKVAGDGDGYDWRALEATIKQASNAAIGKLAQQSAAGQITYRPHWRHAVIAKARDQIAYRLERNGQLSGRWPVLAVTDAIAYVSDEADPVAAWPGSASDLAGGFGRWKVLASGLLAEWGPTWLDGTRLDAVRLGAARDALTLD